MERASSLEASIAYGPHHLYGPASVTFGPDSVEIVGRRITPRARRRAFLARCWCAGIALALLVASTIVPDLLKFPALALMVLAGVVFLAECRPDLMASEDAHVLLRAEDLNGERVVDEDTRLLYMLVFGFWGLLWGKRRRGVLLSVADPVLGEIDYEFLVDSPDEFVDLSNAVRTVVARHG